MSRSSNVFSLKKMNLDIIEHLRKNFEKSLVILNQTVLISSVTQDTDYKQTVTNIHHSLDQCRHELRALDKEVNRAKSQVYQIEDLKKQSQQLLQHLQFTLSNFPSKVPYKKSLSCSAVSNGICGQGESGQPGSSDLPSITKKCQFLDFLTVDEFEAVPKYMKGRLTYDKVNSVIEQLDSVYAHKYKIMSQKKSSLNDANRKRFEAFRLQESKDTKGVYFIVEKDISDMSSMTVDNSLRNILTVLRHCSLIQEIRGGGFVRYAITSGY